MLPINHLQERKCWYGVGGAARKTLQVDILRKFLQFTEASRKRVGAAGFIEALYRDSVEVVDRGYMKLVESCKALGKILVILIFTAFHSISPTCTDAIACVVYLMYGQRKVATNLRLKVFRAQNRMLAHAEDVSKNFLLIRDYQRRPEMSSRMQRLVDDVNYFSNAVWAHTTRSQLIVPLLSVYTVGGLMGGAPWIIDKFDMTAGVFLAVLQATTQMGHEVEVLFSALLQVQLSISALLKIYSVMNMQTDIAERMLANRKQRERGKEVEENASRITADHANDHDEDGKGLAEKSLATRHFTKLARKQSKRSRCILRSKRATNCLLK